MTPSFAGMLNSVAYETPLGISLKTNSSQTENKDNTPDQEISDDPKLSTTTTSNQYSDGRLGFLRRSAAAETARGIPGVTPPYCPAGPTLLRETFEDSVEPPNPKSIRARSPLHQLALSNYSVRTNIKYDKHFRAVASTRASDMPHAVSTAHSGFQALVLCGPGIGLSTFTSVPGEFPKALINVANRPMVWYVLDWCYRMGVTDITLITPPAAKSTFAAALAQNPYLTSLPSPSPDLLSPQQLEFTTPTAELLRLPEVQAAIKSDFLLLPCDLICDISGDAFLESYLTSLGGVGGVGAMSDQDSKRTSSKFSLGGEGSGRRGGLSIWYNTADREESIKGEECDFMSTVKLDSQNDLPVSRGSGLLQGNLRKLVWTMPMSELWDQVEENKSWKIRQSLLRKYGAVKCMTRYRDSHIYFFPSWVKDFAALNDEFESVSEDLVGTWAKAEWRKPSYRAKFGAQQVFAAPHEQLDDSQQLDRQIEEEIDLLSLSSTQVTQHEPRTVSHTQPTAQLASRVQAKAGESVLSPQLDGQDESGSTIPMMPPMLSYILPSEPSAPLVRRIDTTPLLLSVSLLLAKLPSIEDSMTSKSTHSSPFAHPSKIAGTATIAQRTTISRADTLIDSNSSIATQCVIKNSCIGSSVSVGQGARITGCVIMDGATIGDKCVLTNTVIGKKAVVGKSCTLQNCEVQDGNAIHDKTEGKGEKYLIGGLEDEVSGEEFEYGDDDDGDNEEDGEEIDLEE